MTREPTQDVISGQVFASVWDAFEDSPEAAHNLRLRSELLIAIQETVAGWGVTQTEAARRLEVTQPRLNDMLRGRIDKFSLDALALLAAKAGLAVRLKIARTRVRITRGSATGVVDKGGRRRRGTRVA
jgi:predicted XRE-type DNA-binding protein